MSVGTPFAEASLPIGQAKACKMDHELCLFALNASRDFAMRVAAHLGVTLAAHEEREFDDGEHKARPLVNVRGRDVFVVQSLYEDEQQSVNDKLCRLLFFLGALRDASAGRLTAVVPYLCYARKDRKSQSRDPVTTRYVASMFEALGADRVVTLDVHNLAAFQNAFRCHTDHLEALPLFVDHFAAQPPSEPIVVLSPDTGGIKRAEKFRDALSRRLQQTVSSGFMEKYRAKDVVSGGTLFADVTNRSVIIVDDLISSGTTISRAAAACRSAGAINIYAAASHGLFTAKAEIQLQGSAIERIAITNTVPPFRLDELIARDKLIQLDVAPLFAAAIERIHSGGSIVELLET